MAPRAGTGSRRSPVRPSAPGARRSAPSRARGRTAQVRGRAAESRPIVARADRSHASRRGRPGPVRPAGTARSRGRRVSTARRRSRRGSRHRPARVVRGTRGPAASSGCDRSARVHTTRRPTPACRRGRRSRARARGSARRGRGRRVAAGTRRRPRGRAAARSRRRTHEPATRRPAPAQNRPRARHLPPSRGRRSASDLPGSEGQCVDLRVAGGAASLGASAGGRAVRLPPTPRGFAAAVLVLPLALCRRRMA